MKKWLDPTPVSVPEDLSIVVAGHPLVAETLVRRGITDAESARRFLNPDAVTPASPYDLPDMVMAVSRVDSAIQKKQQICIWGDFDVDGQTASALLVSALKRLGANVTYYIPHRLTEGHGITITKLDDLINKGAELILTCDTGIAEHEAVTHAISRGVDVVITDHHQLSSSLPDALAAVNPQRLPKDHPLHTMPGVGVAYLLVDALYTHAGYRDELPELLDLVALGIVADVAVQTGDTRYYLQRGLDTLRSTQRLGLQALYQIAEIDPAKIDAETIGFAIAPRLNALGRLGDANAAVEFLTTNDPERAHILANQLDALNNERKLLSEQVFQAARSQIEENPQLLDHAVLVLGNPNWPGGIIGIVANRLVETYNRPVILLRTPPQEAARGSARSVPGIDITAAIAAQAHLLDDYGGHTMAAGLSLPQENIEEFRRALSRAVQADAATIDHTPTLPIDAYLPLGDVSVPLVNELAKLAPFGAGNPPLTLATQKLTLKSHKQLGRTGRHVRLTVEDNQGATQEVVWWNAELAALPNGRFDLAYTLSMNDYRGKSSLQMTVVDVRPVEEEPLEFAHRSNVEVVDLRHLSAGDQLDELAQFTDALIWNEGEKIPGINAVRRNDLRPAPILVIWSAPPSIQTLQAALETVNPATIVLFNNVPPWDTQNAFLQRLEGLVKYATNNKDGETTLSALAGATAHAEATIHTGLNWLQMQGKFSVTVDDSGMVHLSDEQGKTTPITSRNKQKLKELLEETRSYRAHFKQANKITLVQV